jgi:hypothetical protein
MNINLVEIISENQRKRQEEEAEIAVVKEGRSCCCLLIFQASHASLQKARPTQGVGIKY